MTTDLPALDTYDAEIVDITVSYSIRISQAEATAAAARRTLADAEATLAELTSERANAVHHARERLLTATGAEIRDGGIRGKPGRPTRRSEPPALLSPTAAPEPVIDAAVAEASAILAAPAGEAPTAAEEFIADVSEPEKTLFENGYSPEEVAAMDLEERWALKATNLQRADAIKNGDGRWIEPTENEEAPF